jgi:hypothetical protein
LENELLATMLKTLKNLTMLPVGLQVLQNANAIETLTKVLKEQIERDPDTPLTTVRIPFDHTHIYIYIRRGS